MGGTNYQSLLTDDARRAHLDTVVGHRYTHQGQLSLPSLTQYNSLATNEGLQAVGIELCRWIGLKPNGLQISFHAHLHDFKIDTHNKTILIPGLYRRHPYSCGSILALAVIAYAIEKLSHTAPDRMFIEFASVELGFGAWIINSQLPKTSLSHKLYHMIDSSWYQSETLHLQNYTSAQYIQAFIQYSHANRIAADSYLPHILKRCQHLFPVFIQNQSSRFLPEANIAIQHKKAGKLLWAKLGLGAAIIALAALLSLYTLTNSSFQDEPRRQQQRSIVEDLRQQYDSCEQEAAKKQNSYDPNDLFMTRQIDAVKSRCESLRNQYNYAVDLYKNM